MGGGHGRVDKLTGLGASSPPWLEDAGEGTRSRGEAIRVVMATGLDRT